MYQKSLITSAPDEEVSVEGVQGQSAGAPDSHDGLKPDLAGQVAPGIVEEKHASSVHTILRQVISYSWYLLVL